MTDNLKIALDTLQKEMEVDTSIVLCQSMSINTFLHGNQVSHWNQVPGSHINSKAVKTKLVYYWIKKDILWECYWIKEVSVTAYINVISYVLIYWTYYELLALSLLNPQWFLLMLKLDPDPIVKTWYKLFYYTMGGIDMKSSVQIWSIWFSKSKYLPLW